MASRSLVLATIAALTVLAAVASIAFAHSRPIRFDPAPGAVLGAAPSQVDGWFTGDIRRDPNWSFIRVEDSGGAVVSTGEPVLSDDRRQITTALQSGLAPGIYKVTWRTWDDLDGAILGDCYYFYVGQAAAEAAYEAKTRLDVGRDCDRIDVEAEEGTPVPGATAIATEEHGTPAPAATPAPSASPAPTSTAEPPPSTDSGEDGGLSAWLLAVGIVAGLGVGAVGGRLIGR
jgi:methionine-rich copper-binding protein CopC